ncbi:MAG: methyltransferase, partial [Acetobacteraceae bacterium]
MVVIDAEAFVRAHTVPGHAPLVPEIALLLASEITPIWQATETWLAIRNVDPPFWAFAWPGGQALARHILDHPGTVAGRRVLDFAAGGGIAAIACARAGA